MKYVLVVLALIVSTVASAYTSEDPHERFMVTNVNSNNIAITFISTKNIQATCDAESKKRGYSGFPMSVEACSFWDASKTNNRCTIVVGQTTNYHTIGHEMRHCLQGNFHR